MPHTHTDTHTHTHTQTHTHTHTHTHIGSVFFLGLSFSGLPILIQFIPVLCADTMKYLYIYIYSHTDPCTRTRTHTHTHTSACLQVGSVEVEGSRPTWEDHVRMHVHITVVFMCAGFHLLSSGG